MHRRRGAVLVLTTLALAAPACDGPQPLAPGDVTVTLTAVHPDPACATVSPVEATIWRDTVGGKPHRVAWVAASPGDFRWRLERDPGKPGGDHFPPRQILCRDAGVNSGPPRALPPVGEAHWGYRVALFPCDPSVREPLCTVDPKIIIKDSGP